MEREFCSYEQALDLKELGFDEKCLSRYCAVTEWEELTGQILLQDIDCNVSERFLVKAPLKQQVFRWFREKYSLLPNIWSGKINHIFYGYDILHIKKQKFVINNTDLGGGDCDYDTYEEAENACIDKLIELAKQQDND